jgi:hypothetical protein
MTDQSTTDQTRATQNATRQIRTRRSARALRRIRAQTTEA